MGIFILRNLLKTVLLVVLVQAGKLDLKEDTKNFRLAYESVPSKYILEIKPFLKKDQKIFEAEVKIHFSALKKITSVILNQEGIEITDHSLYQIDEETEVTSNQIPIDKCVPDNKYQKYECKLLSGPLDPNQQYMLSLKYKGKIYDDMRGLHESYYLDENQKKKAFGLTHLGIQARRLLPCFDEPRYKAEFEITVVRNPKVHKLSLANAQFVNTLEKNSSIAIDTYKPTSKIPSYALALILSDFDAILDFDARGNHTFGTYARDSALDQLSFAFQLSSKLIRQLDDWTKINYYEIDGVDKLEIVAVPDYPVRALANWGLVVQRETCLLVDDAHTNTQQEEKVALTLSNGISHMWFGILVTSDWFDTLWLNEGFATYFEFLTLNAVESDWKVSNSFVVSVLQSSFQSDAYRSAHPLTKPGVNSYSEIQALFTSITSHKGASILRMMHNLMRPGTFQTSIRAYLESKAYETVKPDDLFILLERNDPEMKPTAIMKSYTEQPGYPLVSVTKKGNVLKLSQKRFLSDEIEHNDKSTWNIPITLALNKQDWNNVRSHLTLFPKSNTFELEITAPTLGYYLLNIQQTGYYRVNYDEENWLAIKKALLSKDFGEIHVLNRAQIIDDLFNLAKVGYLNYDFAFDILKYVKNEKDYLPWQAALNGLSFLETRFKDMEYKMQFRTFVKEILSGIYSHLAFLSNGTHTDKLNRINILSWACRYGNENCVKSALSKFEESMKGDTFDPDWMPSVYCTGARNVSNQWEALWNKFKNSDFPTEKETILASLGCSKDKQNIQSFLDKILTEDIRRQDKNEALIYAIKGNPENVDYVLEYLLKYHEKWSKIMDLGRNFAELANHFTDNDQIKKLEDFMKTTALPEATKSQLKSAIEVSKKNIQWDQQRIDELKKFFGKNSASMQTFNFILTIFTILSVFNYFMFN